MITVFYCVTLCVLVSSDHSEDDMVFTDGMTNGATTAHALRWSHYQPSTWMKLLDEQYHEVSVSLCFFSIVTALTVHRPSLQDDQR